MRLIESDRPALTYFVDMAVLCRGRRVSGANAGKIQAAGCAEKALRLSRI